MKSSRTMTPISPLVILPENRNKQPAYACAYWLFTTDDPFRSIGIKQTEVLNKAISGILLEGVNAQCIRTALELTINSEVDRETLHSELFDVLLRNLKTTDAKDIAIGQCLVMKTEFEQQREKSKATKAKTASYSNDDYSIREKINYITEMVFRLYCSLCEYDEAIQYFHKNHIERDKEITIYILLELLYEYDMKEYWLREYERAVSAGIEPRSGLKKIYKIVKETGEFTDSFYI